MFYLITLFFNKKRFTILLSIMLLIFGIKSYSIIPKEGAPQVKVPYVFVSIIAEGYAPKDSERMILKPLEKEISQIQGVKNITAYSYVNHASVAIEFDAGMDTNFAINEVRDKVDIAKIEFPKEVEDPIISEVDLSAMPVLNVILLASNVESIMPLARSLRDEIELISEVLKVEIRGEQIEAVEVQISSSALRQFNISIEDILQIKNNNKLISSGVMRSQSGEFSINVPSLVKDYREIGELPINLKGSTINLKDISKIIKTHKDRESIARINGKEAIVLQVSKRSGENIINTISKVRNTVKEHTKNIGDNIQIRYTRDASQKIRNSLSNLQNNIILAVIIVFIIVMNLMGFRQAILIGLSVPLSFFIAIWVLYTLGISLNIVVLFGLVLSVGIIVDATSVIVEYASQKISSGMEVGKAYLESVKKMFVPVTISTITVLIVSTPLLAFPGIVGGFMKYLPLTLIIVLISSLFVALFIIPTLGALFDRPSKKDTHTNLENKPIVDILKMKGIVGWYARTVLHTLTRPLTSFVVLIILVASIVIVYIFYNKGVEFFPNIETNYIRGFVRGVGNISLEERERALNSVTQKVIKEIGGEVDVYYTVSSTSAGNSDNTPKDTIGTIDIQLVDWQIRRKAHSIIKHLRNNITEDGFIVNFDKEKDGPPQSTDIYYEVFDYSIEKLEKAIVEMRKYLDNIAYLQNIEDTRAPPRIEYQVKIDKSLAMQYGVNSSDLSKYIKLATNGVLIDKYSPSYLDEKSEIILRYPKEERSISQILSSFIIKNGKSIPIANFVNVVQAPELVEIVRKNGKPMIALKAGVKETYTGDDGKVISVIKSEEKSKIFHHLQKIANKHDVNIYAGGTDEDQKETMSFLMSAFAIALVVIFLVFLVEFNSFGYALIIMSSIFLSIVGVLFGFLISQSPLGIVMSGIGIISLAGIVVSNNLIYLDFFQTLQSDDDSSTKDSLIRASVLRARPILLTSVTTIVGLLPAMFGVGIDFTTGVLTINSPTSQWWVQLSSAIVGGLTFATILTLFFTPSKVLLNLRLKGYVRKIFSNYADYYSFGKLFKK